MIHLLASQLRQPGRTCSTVGGVNRQQKLRIHYGVGMADPGINPDNSPNHSLRLTFRRCIRNFPKKIQPQARPLSRNPNFIPTRYYFSLNSI
ncbi:hypothetical protein RJ639_006718 [Escallonia herrerae]|uniref:Uncharacterized protein n=1 Tax=Escallonia herrerae TaxID=1293975 RepID=A0AA89AVF4_9ASTE|nr:hypothetical protein RJ639_006718 [Escallonia herrerae]